MRVAHCESRSRPGRQRSRRGTRDRDSLFATKSFRKNTSSHPDAPEPKSHSPYHVDAHHCLALTPPRSRVRDRRRTYALSISIGATTAIFAALNTILLKPLPYRDPGRLAGVWFNFPRMNFNRAPQSGSSYFTLRQVSHSIEGMGVVDRSSVNLAIDGGAASADACARPSLRRASSRSSVFHSGSVVRLQRTKVARTDLRSRC